MLPLGKALSFALSITLPRHRKPEEHFFHLRSGQSYTIQWHLVPTIVGRIAMPQRHHRALLWLWTKVHTTLFQSVLQYFLFSYPRLIIIFTSLCSNTQDTQLSFSSWYQDGTLRSVLSLFSWLYSMRHFPRVTLNDSAICRFRPKQQKQHVRLLSSGQSWLFQTVFFVGQNFLVSFYDFRRRPRWREIDGPWSKHPLISHQINEQTHRLSGVGSHLLRWCGPSRHRLSDWLVAGLPLVTDWPARGHSSRRLMASSHYVTHSFHISFFFTNSKVALQFGNFVELIRRLRAKLFQC